VSGFETTQGWCSRTVNRQAPLAMVLVTLVKAWYARCALQSRRCCPPPAWYPHKVQPSLADMLAALRRVLWQHRITSTRGLGQSQRLFQIVSFALPGQPKWLNRTEEVFATCAGSFCPC